MRTFLFAALAAFLVMWLAPGPWWLFLPALALVGFAAAPTGRVAFWAGFLASGLVWAIWAAAIHYGAPILGGRMARLLPLGGQPFWFFPLNMLLGGLLGGLATAAGRALRSALARPRRRFARR